MNINEFLQLYSHIGVCVCVCNQRERNSELPDLLEFSFGTQLSKNPVGITNEEEEWILQNIISKTTPSKKKKNAFVLRINQNEKQITSRRRKSSSFSLARQVVYPQ